MRFQSPPHYGVPENHIVVLARKTREIVISINVCIQRALPFFIVVLPTLSGNERSAEIQPDTTLLTGMY